MSCEGISGQIYCGLQSLYNTLRSSLSAAAEESAAGCVAEESQICEAGSDLPFPGTLNHWQATPRDVHVSEFDAGPVRLCWMPQSDTPAPIVNCDGESLEGISLFCDLGTGNGVEKFIYDENGHLEICGFFEEVPGQINCSYSFTDLRTEEILTSTERQLESIHLYPPRIDTSYIPDACNDNPLPRHGGRLISWEPTVVTEGTEVVFSYPADAITECDGTSDSLTAAFIINGERHPATRVGNRYVTRPMCLEYPDPYGGYEIRLEVTDESRGYTVFKTSELWMQPLLTSNDLSIYSSFGPDGSIVGRPVILELSFLTIPPDADYTVTWQVYNSAGEALPNEQQPGEGRITSFVPQATGRYFARATVAFAPGSTCGEVEPIIVEGPINQPILPFAAPSIEIDGNRYPAAGTSSNYQVVAMRTEWRALGEEDAAATYSVRVYREGESAAPLLVEEHPISEIFNVAWPMVEETEGSKLYIMEVTVMSEAYAEPVVLQIPITVYAPSTLDTEAAVLNIVTDYPDRITNRPIMFRASEIDGVIAYSWRINQIDGAPVDIAIGEGVEIEHVFTAPGNFNIELTLLNGSGAIINTTTQPIRIYSFPAPEVELAYTDPLFAGEESAFVLSIGRAGGLWAEDDEATITWRVSHDETGGVEIDDMAHCLASGRDISCNFPSARTYKIEYNLQGAGGAYTVNRVELVTVYAAGAAAADFFVTTPFADRITHRPIEFRAAEMDGAASYTWQIIEIDGEGVSQPLGSGREISHTFTEEGTYTIELVVRNADGEEISRTSDAITVYPFPAPTVSLYAASEPLFTGEDSTFILSVARGGGLIDEDRDAEVTWRVFHNEAGGRAVSDMALCRAAARDITCNFSENRTYGVEYTLRSPGGEYEISDVEFFDVYSNPAVRPPRVNVTVEPETFGPYTNPFTFDARRSTVAEGREIETYWFDFADGAGPREVALGWIPFTFPRAGTYNVVVTVVDNEGDSSQTTLEMHPY